MDGKTQAAAAAAAGMSLRTAREWDSGPAPSATKLPRDWRTRPDPFADGLVDRDRAAAEERHQGRARSEVRVGDVAGESRPIDFSPGQVRTLQRRFRDWRALHGPEPEVYFPQVAVPGREAAIDFTHATDLGVTIAGVRVPASAVRLRAELQRVDVDLAGVRRDLRGAGRRAAGRPLGARRPCRRCCAATICRRPPTS